ncbi:MAG: hypothetical protein LBC64_06095 [Fibromonadaceae bacterium]|jgi:hypothetical protein|nr:hypothetical protein [Fibromonadaceae bacterium]
MSYVKEPAGVDFVIKSMPLTDKGRQEIDAFIKASKAKQKSVNAYMHSKA